MQDIDAYIAKAEYQPLLTHIRQLVRSLMPGATEKISYGMPAFYYKGKYLVAYGAFKDHVSIFPGAAPIAELAEQLKPFETGKGTIQLTPEHLLGDELITDIVMHSKAAIDARL